jgi:hypothetical protein
MPKKEGFRPNLDSIWKEGKGKPGGRVKVGFAELFGKDSIDKNLDLGLIEEVQRTEVNPAKLRDHLDKAEESLNKLPHSENVKHLTSYLAQTCKLLDEEKISSSELTSEQRKFDNKVVQWEFGSGVYDEDALREVSNRIDSLEKRIQKAVDGAMGALGGKKSADKRLKDRKKAGKLWEEHRKSGMSKRFCDEEVAAKMKKDKRTIERWRKEGKWDSKQ